MALFEIEDQPLYRPFQRDEDINFKECFGGIPKSIMRFGKDAHLMKLIGEEETDLGTIDGDAHARGGGYAKNLRYSIYNPVQAKMILEYYTEPGYLVLDPFMGRGTRPVMTVYTGRNYYGYDTSKKTVEHNREMVEKNFPNTQAFCKMVHGDGTNLGSHEDEFFDAVFSCPPYYGIERYSGEEGDLSHMKVEEFDAQIERMFVDLYRIIKTSSYSEKRFHPVIFTVGTIRSSANGVLDMDYRFQQAAYRAGFVLYDKLLTENLSPGAGFTFRRNYQYSFLTKVHETTLVFMKF